MASIHRLFTGKTDPRELLEQFTKEMSAPIQQLGGTIRRIGTTFVAVSLVKGLFNLAAKKFFERNPLPVRVNYVDWWPRTRQKVQDFASKFWSRRVEGATATTLSAIVGMGAWVGSDLHPAANSVWQTAKKTTQFCLSPFHLQDGWFDDDILAISVLPSIIGLGTSLALGSYDLIRKYFDYDRILEIKPIFNETLQADLDDILATARTLKEEKGFFQNLLLYGPPGTGKTMISKWIAEHSKMNYILMSGGDLLKNKGDQAGAGAAVATLQKLVEHAKSLSSPTVVFIDEAEACFGKRDNAKKSQELVSLLNAFLELTGQPTSKMMLILATNRPNDIDQAVLSRMDYKIYVGPPELAERKKIIEKTVQILIHSPEDQGAFTENIIDHIAKQTQGFSGRDIFKLVNRLKVEIRQKNGLTTINIDKVITRFVKQEQQIETKENSENPLKANPFYVQKLG